MILTINTDGGARGNPGPAASAFVVYNQTKKIIHQQYHYIGISTNNEAEYKAVLLAYNWLTNQEFAPKDTQLIFRLDSLLVVKQLMGEYKIKSKNLLPLILKIKELEKNFSSVKYHHVVRLNNKLADKLVNQCLDQNGHVNG